MEISAQAKVKISKAIPDVFNAVIDPDILNKFFITTGSHVLREGHTVPWTFDDSNQSVVSFDIEVLKIEEDKLISIKWWPTQTATIVNICFSSTDEGCTVVAVTESGWDLTIAGAAAACGQTGGWTHMLLCMKAYLEFGINLRAGSVP